MDELNILTVSATNRAFLRMVTINEADKVRKIPFPNLSGTVS